MNEWTTLPQTSALAVTSCTTCLPNHCELRLAICSSWRNVLARALLGIMANDMKVQWLGWERVHDPPPVTVPCDRSVPIITRVWRDILIFFTCTTVLLCLLMLTSPQRHSSAGLKQSTRMCFTQKVKTRLSDNQSTTYSLTNIHSIYLKVLLRSLIVILVLTWSRVLTARGSDGSIVFSIVAKFFSPSTRYLANHCT